MKPRTRLVAAAGAVLGALLPMVFGIHLPAVSAPRVVLGDTTLYPSADGLWPMGGYADFASRLRHASREPIDHNQEIWNGLAQTELPNVDGDVPLYWTPMLSYFKLAATLQGKRGVLISRRHYDRAPFLIGDERSLRKNVQPLSARNESELTATDLAERSKSLVSPAGVRQPIVRIEAPSSTRASAVDVERRLALTACFAGNEFTVRVIRGAESEWSPADRGKMVVFFSDASFDTLVEHTDGTTTALPTATLVYDVPNAGPRAVHIARIDPADTLDATRARFVGSDERVLVARAVLPGYMSLSSLH